MYVFLWVFPRRLIKIVVCRRFGTLYQFHLQRLDVRYEVTSYFTPHIQPLKVELILCSETSAYYNFNQTPGKCPKGYIHLDSKHGESLKSTTDKLINFCWQANDYHRFDVAEFSHLRHVSQE